MTQDHAARRAGKASAGITRPPPYARLGWLVVAALLIVGLLGSIGAIPGGAIYRNVSGALFAAGAAVVILASALVYLFLTMRATIDAQIQDRFAELQGRRDGTQDLRLDSLEQRPGTNGLWAQLARAEMRISSLELGQRLPGTRNRAAPIAVAVAAGAVRDVA